MGGRIKRAKEQRVTTFEFHDEGFAVISYPTVPYDGLTPAEREVAELVIAGRSNAHIARARGTSVHTVGNQIASIFRKTGVASRFELVARAHGAKRGER